MEKFFLEVDQFLNSITADRNRWFASDEIKIYIRKGVHSVKGSKLHHFIDLASIDVEYDLINTGVFTKYLKEFVERYPSKNIFIESVLNPRIDSVAKKFAFKKQQVSPECYNLYLLRDI